MPLISVVVATYNTKKLLQDALLFLLQQEFDKNEYEVIVVDDGSNDGTRFFMEEVVKNNPNVRYIIRPHKGVSAARNTGIKLARGEIVAFTDSDCLVDKNWLKEMIKSFEDGQIIGVCGKIVSEPGKITPFTHYVLDESASDFVTCNVAYRKNVLQEINGFDEIFKHGFDDTDLYMRAQEKGKLVSNKNAVVCHRALPWNFVKLVKRIKVEFMGQIRFCKKYPGIFKYRNPVFTILWFKGVKIFFERANREKHWIIKNPIIYAAFIFALMFQRYYLLYLCIFNKNATDKKI